MSQSGYLILLQSCSNFLHVQEIMFEEEIVIYCHHGERAFLGAQILLESGFKKVYHLTGGIDAWSQVVDPEVPRYRG